MALRIGLTGGIASGKSLAQALFEALGVSVLDADQVARDVVAIGSPALAQIAAQFGAQFLLPDGSLDRRRMREHVFAHADARKQLEAITHPAIRAQMRAWCAAQTAPYCMLSVAILVEGSMLAMVDRVLVVDVPVETQLQRLMARDDADLTLARQMLAAQTSREARLAKAHDVLLNTGTVETLREAVKTMHAFYLQIAADGRIDAPGLRLPDAENSVTIKI